MPHRIFVYGTLKQGFCNFGVNGGRRVEGSYQTVQRLPLYLVGPLGLPWLVEAAGQGHRVLGQLFDVDPGVLARMDALERVTERGWYRRSTLQVGPQGGELERPLTVEAYFGCPSRLTSDAVHLGPLAEYTLAHQWQFRGREP